MNGKNFNNVRQPPATNLHAFLNPGQLQTLLLDRCKTAALEFGIELLEQDVESLCGKRYERKAAEGLCHRAGSDETSIILDGVKLRTKRPRVRDENGEVDLPTLAKLQDQDLFDDQIKSRLLRGISTRNYSEVVAAWSKKTGVSKSSVSRAFIRVSKKSLEELNHMNLSKFKFVGIMIDGVDFAGTAVIVALGLTDDLQKIPLGIREGDTENSVVVKDLLASIIERGFVLRSARLIAVLDGAKALKKAVTDVFGERVILQRCWLHKLRNLKKYMPEKFHGDLYWRMKKLMGMTAHADAKSELLRLTEWLDTISLSAGNSLRECGDDLLTVHELNLPRILRNSLSTTNAIESLIGVVRDKTGRVKNWKSKTKLKVTQIARWVASSILEHRSKMRRLYGHKHAAALIIGLDKNVAPERKLA